MLDAVEYKNSTKRHSRAFLWNRLKALIRNRKNSLILYLPGSRALDVEEAERRGFRSENMIAIEKKRAIVRHLRDSGLNVIQGNILDVMACWNSEEAPTAILADLQCGFTQYPLRIAETWMFMPALHSCRFLYVNMLRGRDTGPLLAAAKTLRESDSTWLRKAADNQKYVADFIKHRGIYLSLSMDLLRKQLLREAARFNAQEWKELNDLYDDSGLPLAKAYWDEDGQCYLDSTDIVCNPLNLGEAFYAADADMLGKFLAEVLADTQKPDDVEPVNP